MNTFKFLATPAPKSIVAGTRLSGH